MKLALIATAALLRRFDARCHARIASLKFSSIELLRAERIWTALVGSFRLLSLAVGLAAVFVYLDFALGLFPQTRLLSVRLLQYLLSPLGILGRSLIGLVANLFFIAVVAALTRYGLKFLKLFFTEIRHGRIEFAGFPPEWALPVYGLVRLAVVAVAFPCIPGPPVTAIDEKASKVTFKGPPPTLSRRRLCAQGSTASPPCSRSGGTGGDRLPRLLRAAGGRPRGAGPPAGVEADH